MGPAQELVGRRLPLEGNRDDLEDGRLTTAVAGRRFKAHGHTEGHTRNPSIHAGS
jgi:hypothetical protein